jgi:hypothetical protein
MVGNHDTDGLNLFAEHWTPQSINSRGTDSIHDVAVCYQVASLFGKFSSENAEDSENRQKAALRKYLRSEDSCREFNVRESILTSPPFSQERSKQISWLKLAKKYVWKILGDCPDFDKLDKWARHGPGASTNVRGVLNHKYFKFRNLPYHVTEGSRIHAIRLIQSDARWMSTLRLHLASTCEDLSLQRVPFAPNCAEGIKRSSYYEVLTFNRGLYPFSQELEAEAQGIELDDPEHPLWGRILETRESNVICFVPKDDKIDRPIAIEPTMNLMLQLGVDGHIRTRLKRFGVDIDNQEVNQLLAQEGSMLGDQPWSPCTLDLAAASDSISLKLCAMLLPPEWYMYLCDLRSNFGLVTGLEDEVWYEKIASMGNGYTFALETLLFTAISQAAIAEQHGSWCSTGFHVYGDDIIVPQIFVGNVMAALQFMGFSINREKSFFTGHFRESCGADYWMGTNVRPVFLRRRPDSPEDVLLHANSITRWHYQRIGVKAESLLCFRVWLGKLVSTDKKPLLGPPSSDYLTSYLHVWNWTPSWDGLYRFYGIIRSPRVIQKKDWFFQRLLNSHKPSTNTREWNWREAEKLGRSSSKYCVTMRMRGHPRVKQGYILLGYARY